MSLERSERLRKPCTAPNAGRSGLVRRRIPGMTRRITYAGASPATAGRVLSSCDLDELPRPPSRAPVRSLVR